MSLNLLPLPVDIPWRRVLASGDMLAGGVDFARYPLKWRSSLALFYFLPEVDQPEYADSRIVYFRVVCSITGYQPTREELPARPQGEDAYAAAAWTTISRFLDSYFPCVGALAQVAFTSGPGLVRGRDFASMPVITDFEPKKREVFEAVTETGELMSRSSTGLQVTKGNSSTRSTESSDKESGSLAIAAGVPGYGSIAGTYGLESTTKQGWSSTQVDINQSDASQERRETTSHTTQLTQMYHQLDSYHLGTNRALFVLFPRPHTLAAQLGDGKDGLNWMRKLEGIQEFFFVVEQPKSARMLCLSAHLDTMHVARTTHTVTRMVRDQFQQPGEVKVDHWFTNPSADSPQTFVDEVKLPAGFRVDKSRGNGGYDEHLTDIINADRVVTVFNDYIQIVTTAYPNPPKPPAHPESYPSTPMTRAVLTATYVVYGEQAEPHPVVDEVVSSGAFATGRHLQACLEFGEEGRPPRIHTPDDRDRLEQEHPYVTFEAPLPQKFSLPDGHDTQLRGVNAMAADLKEFIVASVNSPRRYAVGEHTFAETDLATRALLAPRLRDRLREGHDRVVLSRRLREELGEAADRVAALPLSELAAGSAADLADRLAVSPQTLQRVRLEQVGLAVTRTTAAAERPPGPAGTAT
ncbi:hypothetical protein ACQP00_32065 [Dactylosporangium sp. CS-047395]|uniref:hypothetical protein n=1 Tax=Dactylosporangium sp. CS-047395 TaxID=3239936 RepID=UPI003D904708